MAKDIFCDNIRSCCVSVACEAIDAALESAEQMNGLKSPLKKQGALNILPKAHTTFPINIKKDGN
jgi:hypothetical protein